MNSKIINTLVFAAGAAIGSVATWVILRNKYEKLVREEIESIKEAFGGNEPEALNEIVDEENGDDSEAAPVGVAGQINWEDLEDLDEEEIDEDEELNEYARVLDNYTKQEGGAEKVAKAPYVIAPYDFGELDNWDTVELTYYADDILEDDEYNIVTDGDELLGPKALTTFGEYEDDAVFVRNERLRTDFQILRDPRTYDEARSTSPKWVADE
jgi:hypothetical protein